MMRDITRLLIPDAEVARVDTYLSAADGAEGSSQVPAVGRYACFAKDGRVIAARCALNAPLTPIS